jgi:phosphoribosylformylglycinamidine (FGAM) synthase-like enzyme
LGGSHYYALHGYVGDTVPKVYPEKGKKLMDSLSAAMEKGLVKACHDCSEGGIGVAAAEMAFAGGLGMTVNLAKVPLAEPIERDDFILFSESNTRFIAEVAPEHKGEFEDVMSGVDFAEIGQVIDNDRFEVYSCSGKLLTATLGELKEAWQKPLRW